MLFFICHTHIPGRIFLFLIICEYFCRRFIGGILNHKQDESTNINKRDGKKKGCFISRFPYFTAYHGRIWISGTDHLESAYHISTAAEEGWSWTLAFHSFYKQRILKNIKKYVSMGYIGFKTSIKHYFYPIFSVQSSVFSLMFNLIRHRVNKYLQS